MSCNHRAVMDGIDKYSLGTRGRTAHFRNQTMGSHTWANDNRADKIGVD